MTKLFSNGSVIEWDEVSPFWDSVEKLGAPLMRIETDNKPLVIETIKGTLIAYQTIDEMVYDSIYGNIRIKKVDDDE